MEVETNAFETKLGPEALYLKAAEPNKTQADWNTSSLNPKNRVKRASSDDSPSWEIFGVDLQNLCFFVLPGFAIGKRPVRIDLYISQNIELDNALCKPLHDGISFFARATAQQLRSQPLVLHILHALEYWSGAYKDFEQMYMTLPFGSRILLENIDSDVRQMRFGVVANHDIERQWLSAKALSSIWNISEDFWPETVNYDELEVVSQPHDAVTIVTLPRRCAGKMFVFKSSTKKTKFLYHELKLLLKMTPHPNIISRPPYVVKKRCKFGGKFGICGFLLDFHPTGSLSSVLQKGNPIYEALDLATQFRWAVQLASALVGIIHSVASYFSDFKLDNIVLKKRETEGGYDAILIDFEQRGAWFSWSPPEINHIMVLEAYIFSTKTAGTPDLKISSFIDLLQGCVPDWKRRAGPEKYEDNMLGYNPAWLSFTAAEREKAAVFMLGKVLWCIFEGQGTMNSNVFYGASIFKEVNPGFRFPEFRKTPPRIRRLIRDCTSGAPEWLGETRYLTAVGNVVYPVAKMGCATPQETLEAVQMWWRCKIQEAHDYLEHRLSGCEEPCLMRLARQRPSADVVLRILQDFGRNEGLL